MLLSYINNKKLQLSLNLSFFFQEVQKKYHCNLSHGQFNILLYSRIAVLSNATEKIESTQI